jgi:hypothetical protein
MTLLSPVTTGTSHVTSAPVRVASVPAGHPYVARVTAGRGVHVLPDPLPDGAEPGRWWPPVVLDPRWIADHAAEADLLHLHFGTESFTPEHLAATLHAAHDAGWPVVMTVHDLAHPQLADQRRYAEQLNVLVPGADALITLTPGAAAEIAARWGRDALVLPHPRLLTGNPPTVPPTHGCRVIGLHLKDLRPNVDPIGTTRALLAALSDPALDGLNARAEVRLHRSVRDPRARDAVRALCASSPMVTLIEHDRLDDAELEHSLAGLDACVLPYRHGTHSGWLELCWDLGVPVAAPAVGYYGQQHGDGAVSTFRPNELAVSLRDLLRDGTRAGTADRDAVVRRRHGERSVLDAATAERQHVLYRALLAGSAR